MKTQSKLRAIQKALSCGLIAGMSLVLGSSVDAQTTTVIDDFSSFDPANYTDTVILNLDPDNNAVPGNPLNTAVWGSNGGGLELTTSNYDGIQQHAYIRDGLALFVGQEVQLDIAGGAVAGNRNFGLYVGGTAPAADVRTDYISVYGGSAGAGNRIFTRGFDGADEFDNLFDDPANAAANTLFIAQPAANIFEVGFYDSTGRVIVETRNPGDGSGTPPRVNGFANTANFVGFYADSRANGTISSGTELRIVTAVPEPGTLALLGLVSVAGLVRRRK